MHPTAELEDVDVLESARSVLRTEAGALQRLCEGPWGDFVAAVSRIASCPGKVAVSGLGKSGLVGRKIAATLSSTGTPAVFLHPVDAMHGDAGMLVEGDVLLALSHSGETEEVLRLAEHARSLGAAVFAMSGGARSSLGRAADLVIPIQIDAEACQFDLIPTASTTALMALGDALAICVMKRRGFRKEDFARLHPGGSLGRRLTLRVEALMRRGDDLPAVPFEATVSEALVEMTRRRSGAVAVTLPDGRLAGFFTDGDLRRRIQHDEAPLSRAIFEVMTFAPRTVGPRTLASDAARLMAEEGFDNLPVVDEETGKLVGLIDERDLLVLGERGSGGTCI